MMEIGTWSNAMAEDFNDHGNSSEDEWDGLLPPNISICSRNKRQYIVKEKGLQINCLGLF